MQDPGQSPLNGVDNDPTGGLPFSTSLKFPGANVPVGQSLDEANIPEIDSSTSDSTASLSTVPVGSSGFLITPDAPAASPGGSSTSPSNSSGGANGASRLDQVNSIFVSPGVTPAIGSDPTPPSQPLGSSGGIDPAPILMRSMAVSSSSAQTTASPLVQTAALASDPPNPIVLENEKPGTPEDIWQVDPGSDSTKIQGFTTSISTNLGGTVNFKIDNQTGNSSYHIDIYRLGYYGGDGARLITTVNHTGQVVQPAPLTDPTTGLVDAGNWQVTDSWTVPTDATSGVYVANVIDGSQVFQIPLIIRNDASHSDIVFQTDDETWQAYNGYGGANLYGGEGPGINGAAYAVSYNRPIITRDAGTFGNSTEASVNDMVFSAEFPAIEWLEENGYDVSYISGIDAATSGSLLLNHKVYMDVGHDEYWTDSQRANVQAAGNAGVNLMFLSGNEVYWQTRLQPSIATNGDPNRTLITYKDTHANAEIDPTGTATGSFEDARFASTGGMSGIPSNSLTGTLFAVDADREDVITIPYGETNLRFWRNTPVANTAQGGTASLVPNLLGYEWDSSPDNGFRPGGLIDLSSTTLTVPTKLLDYGNTVGTGTATHNLVEFRNPVSGALVFGAGTVFWSFGLSTDHDQFGGNPNPVDPSVQQATINLFADMGVQPETLQQSLVLATQSTDHTAPTSTVTQVSSTNVVEGQTITVSGTASDVGGLIGGVEVSSDGGQTWHPATSQVGAANVTWTYSFKAGAPGTTSIRSRAADDSLNLESPGSGVSYTSTPSTNLTLFSPTDTPATLTTNDHSAVEVGVKFSSATPGDITGIRFYKGPDNTGTHIGDLWSSDGTLLGSATFTNETASGWQQVNFATPVHIQPNVTYIASYHTNVGDYSSTDFYFDNSGHTNGSLTATGNGLNGVFAYGDNPTFPSTVSIVNGDNYWVDVVFNDTSLSPQANNDSGFSLTENGSLNIAASTLLANDSDPSGLSFSLTSVSAPNHGTVSYNPNTSTVTFTPTAGYAGPASFLYTITDSQGAAGTGQVSLNVNYPTSAQSLFGTDATPTTVTVNDPTSVELGVKFVASASGTATGVRFYKGPQNVGPHIADLWSDTGTLLATATFTNETASGWQEVNFSSPVFLTAGTTYIASYHTNGDYSADSSFFTTPLTNGELTAPTGLNGVYGYGAEHTFPVNSFSSSNYWVDVVFNGTSLQPPVANNDSGISVPGNNTTVIPAATLLANDSDPNGLSLTITGVSNPTNGTVTYDAANQAVDFVPTAGYIGPASFSYTISDGQSATATANVSLNVTPPPPTAAPDSGFVASENGTLSISASTLLQNDVDPGGFQPSVTGVSNPTHGTVSFNSSTQTVTFTPAANYIGTAGFTYSIGDTNGGAASGSVSLFVNDPTSQSLFSLNSTPSQVTVGDHNAVELGVRFTPGANGTISGIRFYKGPENVGQHTAELWSSTGTLIASATFADETSSGWQQVNFSSPIAVTAGTTYVASYHAANGEYSANSNFFKTTLTSGQLSAPGSNNGVYAYSASPTFPTNTFDASNYWVDVVFNGPGLVPPTANNDSGLVGAENSTISIPASTLLANDSDPNGLPLSVTGVSNSTHGSVSLDAASQTISFVPTAGYAGPAGFTYTISDGQAAPASANVSLSISPLVPAANNDSGFVTSLNNTLTITGGSLTANDTDPSGLPISITGVNNSTHGTASFNATNNTVTFVPDANYSGAASFLYSITDANGGTSSATASMIVNDPSINSLFDPATAPSIASADDPHAVELGFKFTTSGDGQVTGLRFYKGDQNTGPHVADLWSSAGTLLASANFTDETPSGWQQVNFATPVQVTAGTTLVASYHTDGNYAVDPNFFATAHTNGPITAPSSSTSGGNGVFAYGGSSLFPTDSFNAASYGVDVLFKPQLAS